MTAIRQVILSTPSPASRRGGARPGARRLKGVPVEIVSRRSVGGPAGLLLEALGPDPGGAALVVGSPRAVVALAVRAAFPDCDVHYQTFEAHELARWQAVRSLNPDLSLVAHLEPRLIRRDGGFDSVFLGMHLAGDRRYHAALLHEAYASLSPRGKLYAAIDSRRDRWLGDNIKSLFGSVSRVHQTRQGQVYVARRTGGKSPRERDFSRSFTARLWGEELELETRPGVFSHGELDEGTLALSESTELVGGETVIDLGCGCGALGIAAARKMGSGRAILVDSNIRAVAQSRRNILATAMTGSCLSLVGADLGAVREGAVDRVLANPPYFGNFSISELFVREAHRVLRPGGSLHLVTRAPEENLELIHDHFATPDVEVGSRRGYSILAVVKPGERRS